MTRKYELSIFQITTMNSEIKGVLSKALLLERYIFPVDMIDEILLASEVNFSENEKDYIDYFNKLLSEITSFRIHSLDIKEVSVEFNNFCIDEMKKDNSNAADHLAKKLNPITDENISKLTKGCVEIQFSSIYTIIQNLDKLIKEYVHEYTKVYALETTKTEETKPEVIDVETIIVPSDEEINNSVDINKELDEEAQEEIPDEEVMNDAEEVQEEKNEETIAEAQEEKNEETIVSSSSEAAERFITDEDLLEKVGDKFFEEAKDKISKIAKNKSLAKKQKKNRINRIVKSYSHKAEDFDPVKETEEKEKIITSVVEDIKKPETIEEKNKDIIDSFPYPETKGNSFIKKILRDNIKNIILSRVDEDIYKIEMPRNGFTDMCYISFGKKSFEIGIRRQMTQGAIIIVPMPSNPALGNISVLNEQVFREVIEVGTMGITQYSDSFISIPFNVKKRAS